MVGQPFDQCENNLVLTTATTFQMCLEIFKSIVGKGPFIKILNIIFKVFGCPGFGL
jgi:hypothetical protein